MMLKINYIVMPCRPRPWRPLRQTLLRKHPSSQSQGTGARGWPLARNHSPHIYSFYAWHAHTGPLIPVWHPAHIQPPPYSISRKSVLIRYPVYPAIGRKSAWNRTLIPKLPYSHNKAETGFFLALAPLEANLALFGADLDLSCIPFS